MSALFAVLADRRNSLVLFAALFGGLFSPGCVAESPTGVEPTLVTLRGATMGTRYSVKCWRKTGSVDEKELAVAVDGLLDTINLQMSTYLDDSELSQFNESTSTDWVTVSSETAHVVEQAIRFHKITDGASDATVGPLVKLWNFGPGKDPLAKDPTSEAIDKVLSTIGCQHIEVRQQPPALRKLVANLEIDLSSIAKGYAVDAVTELLAARGFRDVMVEIGGEVRAVGTRLDERPWRIGIETPATKNSPLYKVVPLAGLAMATSGDYRNFRKSEDRKYCHILDPRTGRPLLFRGRSVTVLSETCLEADALATALLVMGDHDGYDWCVTHDVAALFLVRGEQDIEERATPRFEEVVAKVSPVAER